MNHRSGLDAKRVLQMLGSSLDKERSFWRPLVISAVDSSELTDCQRDEAAARLVQLTAEFRFLPETCGLAISLMDRVLQLVKVRSKYLQCVYVTCLYIAAKTLEEDENIPTTPDLVRRSECGCSFAEIVRMETAILSKLAWNVRRPTAIDFLHMIHMLLVQQHPQLLCGQMSPGEHLSLVTRKLLRCLTSYTLSRTRPSSLVLALISLELERLTPGWMRLTRMVQHAMGVTCEQLIESREAVALFLGECPQSGFFGFESCSRKSSSSAPKSKKRKVVHHEAADDYSMYDGIKRLYSDEASSSDSSSQSTSAGSLRNSCSMELMHQDTESQPPIQALLVN